MDCPSTINPETTESESNIINDTINIYTYEKNDVEYTINIKIIENNLKIIVNSISIDKIDEKNYEASFTFENLKENNKIFGFFDTLQEVLINIESIMNQKNLFGIALLNEKELNLILTQKIMDKNEQIIFKLFKKEKGKDELLYEINLLKQENKILKERLDKVEKKMSVLDINNSMVDTKNSDEVILEQIVFPSKIIPKEDEKNLILRKFDSRNKKVVGIDLLFRASRDGDKMEDIKNAVNEKTNVLSVLETAKGSKIAGFTEKGFDFSKNLGEDKNAFLISFNHYRCYDYGKYKFDVSNNSDSNQNSYIPFYSQNNTYFQILNRFYSNDCIIKIKELNSNEQLFNLKNLEYFQIHFRD